MTRGNIKTSDPIITKVGFMKAEIETSSKASIYAKSYADSSEFRVSLSPDFEDYWFFGAEDCREAAGFFLKLAEELDRREAARTQSK